MQSVTSPESVERHRAGVKRKSDPDAARAGNRGRRFTKVDPGVSAGEPAGERKDRKERKETQRSTRRTPPLRGGRGRRACCFPVMTGSAHGLCGLCDLCVPREVHPPRILLGQSRVDPPSEIVSPDRGGVCTGRRRACVACSKLYPSASSFPSLNAGPKNDSPTGRLSPVKPAGTIRSGKPVRFAMLVADGTPPPLAPVSATRPGRRDEVG